MAESEWPGEELPPRERGVVQALVLKGWVYAYRDENNLVLRSPGGDHWRVKRDDFALPDRQRTEETPAARSLREHLEKLRRHTPAVDLACKTRRPGFTLRQVRSLMRQGYSAEQVVERTGWGAYWFADLVGPDGYYHAQEMGTTA